jgi:uncharacterized MAPEG superfamily protein
MTIAQWVLFGFSLWTLAILLLGIGVSRWSRILTGRAALIDFPADTPHGGVRYRRIVRAHANCLENLPILMVLVYLEDAVGLVSESFDRLAVLLLMARLVQSLTHIILKETNLTILIRFGFYLLQVICLLIMSWEIYLVAAPTFPI